MAWFGIATTVPVAFVFIIARDFIVGLYPFLHGLVVPILLLLSVSFISSIALLKRQNWARLYYIFSLFLQIIGVVYGEIMLFISSEDLPSSMTSLTIFFHAYQIFILAISALIIIKLMSPEIKQEFT